jgi:hypothetical protein
MAISCEMQSDLTQLLEVLDERSRAILWHLWWYRHAEISELRSLIDAASDFEILHRLKEVINRRAQELWGRPVVCFKQSKIDPRSGEKVLFSWWFSDEEDDLVSVPGRPLLDIFNEKDTVTVIAQLPTSVDPARSEIEFRNGILKVTLSKHEKG